MSEHIGKLILRVALGGMMLFHGIDKALHGIGFIKGIVKAHNVPEVLAYGVYIGEIFAPLFLIIGWQSRFWGGVLVFNMLAALYLTKSNLWLSLSEHGAWALELPMLYLTGALAIVFLGSGKYAIIAD